MLCFTLPLGPTFERIVVSPMPQHYQMSYLLSRDSYQSRYRHVGFARFPVDDNPISQEFEALPFTAELLAWALLHLGRHRLALIHDKYGQASDGGLARIDRLVNFPLNYREGLAGLVSSRRFAPALHRPGALHYVFHQRAGVRVPSFGSAGLHGGLDHHRLPSRHGQILPPKNLALHAVRLLLRAGRPRRPRGDDNNDGGDHDDAYSSGHHDENRGTYLFLHASSSICRLGRAAQVA